MLESQHDTINKILKYIRQKNEKPKYKKVKIVYIYCNLKQLKIILNKYKLSYKVEVRLIYNDVGLMYHNVIILHIDNRSKTERSISNLNDVYNFYNNSNIVVEECFVDDNEYLCFRDEIQNIYPDLDLFDLNIYDNVYINPFFKNNRSWKYYLKIFDEYKMFIFSKRLKKPMTIIRSKYVGRRRCEILYALKK